MASPDEPVQSEYDEFKDLCYHIGLALVIWQDVEKAHFLLFTQLLGTGHSEEAAVVYYGIESFEARRKMVGDMANVALKNKADKTSWNDEKGGIQKQLKDANKNRNKLAHYSVEYPIIDVVEQPDGLVTIEFGGPRLRPQPFNLVSRMRGDTPDKQEHNLSVAEVKNMILQFRKVEKALFDFRMGLPPLRPASPE